MKSQRSILGTLKMIRFSMISPLVKLLHPRLEATKPDSVDYCLQTRTCFVSSGNKLKPLRFGTIIPSLHPTKWAILGEIQNLSI